MGEIRVSQRFDTSELKERPAANLARKAWDEMPRAQQGIAQKDIAEPNFVDFAINDPFANHSDSPAAAAEKGAKAVTTNVEGSAKDAAKNVGESVINIFQSAAGTGETSIKSGAGDVVNLINGAAKGDASAAQSTSDASSGNDMSKQIQSLSTQLQQLEQFLTKQQGDGSSPLSGLTKELGPLLETVGKVAPLLMSIL
jgi:hypothetical protein